MLLRRLIPLALLPFTAFTHAACTLTDPTLTLQSYTVNPQQERIVMYWQKQNGKAWGSLRSLLADINKDDRVQMAMNGGIYDKAYEPLGLYRKWRADKAPQPRLRRRQLFHSPRRRILAEGPAGGNNAYQ